jgi:hypothetical protein
MNPISMVIFFLLWWVLIPRRPHRGGLEG